jgi:hypothetical protein
LREPKQLRMRHIARIGNELKQVLIFEIVQVKRSLAIAHLSPTAGGMLTPDANSVQTGKISLAFPVRSSQRDTLMLTPPVSFDK